MQLDARGDEDATVPGNAHACRSQRMDAVDYSYCMPAAVDYSYCMPAAQHQ